MNRLDVLIVDDNVIKAGKIVEVLNKNINSYIGKLISVGDAVTALEELKKNHFDLVILDIRLPYMKGGPVSRNACEDIVSSIIGEGVGSPAYIIGLTEYDEEKSTKLPLDFFSIEHFSSTDNTWALNLVRHVEYIVKSKKAALTYHHKSFDLDVLIITARYENEYAPIFEQIKWEDGTCFEDKMFKDCRTVSGSWETKSGYAFKSAIMCVKYTGLSSTAAVASAAISYYRPRVVAMLGMCCGLNEVNASDVQQLGDVVIMSRTNCWDEGRYTQGINDDDVSFFEARPSSHSLNRRMSKVCDELIETSRPSLEKYLSDKYSDHSSSKDILLAQKQVPASPKVRIGMNVSGSSVVAAKKQTAEIMRRFPGAKSLEMEAHALYTAAYLSPGTESEAICIKGIADFGDGKKSKEYQKIASVGSYLVFEEVLEKFHEAEKDKS